MPTSAWLLPLFLAFVLKQGLCKECTNAPSSSHTVRQALLSSLNGSGSFVLQYAELPSAESRNKNAHGTFQDADNTHSYSEQLESWRKAAGSYETNFPGRKNAKALLVQENPAAQMKSTELFQAITEDLDPRNSHIYGVAAQFDMRSQANKGNMDSDKRPHASRKLFKSNSFAYKTGIQYDEAMASSEPFLQEVSLHAVSLHPHSLQGRAQQTNLEYLLMLDVDSLVWSFRNTSKLPAPGSPYGGWESPTSELRGHFVGHYLSATAQMWASTHNGSLYDKMAAVVEALFECQEKVGSGYLSAFPSEFFDRFENIQPVWAPYYTIHKIMAGLLDQFTFLGNTKALKMASSMADYFSRRVLRVIELHTIERHWESLNEETGGMNDVLYRLYTLTDDSKYLNLAHLFDKPCFLGPLALQADSLSGFHANTHIPVVIGAQMRFEVTGETLYKDVSSFFMNTIYTAHSYPTGGTSAGEFWTDPLHLGDTLSSTETEESCTTYNMLKVSRHLFRWTKQMIYADYYERALTNGVLSIQRGQDPGVMIYMLPMGKGKSKAISYHGWGTKFESFWCCYGTGIESFSKLGDSIYFEDNIASVPSLYIIQLVSSFLSWRPIGLVLNQTVEELSSSAHILRVYFAFSDMNITNRGSTSTLATLQIRIPFWVESLTGSVSLNNEDLNAQLVSGMFLEVNRTWQAGDKLEMLLRPLLRAEKVKDSRGEFSSLYAIFFGPYLLAGMSDGDWDIVGVDAQSLTSWVTPVKETERKMVYSFSQGNASEDAMFLTHHHSSLLMGKRALEGTNGATGSTFKLIDPVITKLVSETCLDLLLNGVVRIVGEPVKHKHRVVDSNEVIGRLVSIELFDEPGRFLTHRGDREVVAFSRADVVQQDDGCRHRDHIFQVVPGLHSRRDHVSFEAVSKPGCFLYTDLHVSALVRLRCNLSVHSSEHLRTAATFGVHRPHASYHQMSFIAKGTNRDYLLSPLFAFKDETYTIFLNITAQ